jgi:hypothetical protein
MRSLKKTSYFTFIIVASLLVFVIGLGIRQYQLSESYSSIIIQSEKMIFQFSSIREQIATSLIENDWEKLSNTSNQLNELNSSVGRLQKNPIIPSEYKLDLARRIDLTSIAIVSKELQSSPDKLANSLILQKKMRVLAEYLIQFDRIIVNQIRAKLIQFQTIMIGALGGIICLISFSLLSLYKRGITPLFHLRQQAEEPDTVITELRYTEDTSLEVAHFVDSINDLLARNTQNSPTNAKSNTFREELADIINESNNLSNGIINYAQLLKDSYREVDMGKEESKILQHIIEDAERIANLHKKI